MPGMIQPERELTWSDDGRLVAATIKSLFTGAWHTMRCDRNDPRAVTRAQWDAWQAGEYIQTAMPQLSDDEREFLLSGATPSEWNQLMKDLDQ